jgi:hypothetical protein
MVKRLVLSAPHLDPGKGPRAHDILLIDGRWAQIGSTPAGMTQNAVRFLDTGDGADIDFRAYEGHRYTFKGKNLIHDERSGGEPLPPTVGLLKSRFTRQEIDRIHWGPEQVEHPDLRYEVTVWGELRKRGN